MQIIFNKYHGAGNDFIIIDNRETSINPDNKELIEKLCNRHMGIGADGLILIDKHEVYDFEMKYYNADGREGSMCGNGGRCAVAFFHKTAGNVTKGSFLAIDGIHEYFINDNTISVSLRDTRPPILIDGNHFINTGSPHYIINVPNCEGVDVINKGRSIRSSQNFAPDGTNVDFVEYLQEGIFVRTYERGVENETLSCGTGVTAAAISSKWDKGPGKYKVDIQTLGGEMSVSFKTSTTIISDIYLTGPASFVFAGLIDL